MLLLAGNRSSMCGRRAATLVVAAVLALAGNGVRALCASATASVVVGVGGAGTTVPLPGPQAPAQGVTVSTPSVGGVPGIGVTVGETTHATPPPEKKETPSETPAPTTGKGSGTPLQAGGSSQATGARSSVTPAPSQSRRRAGAARRAREATARGGSGKRTGGASPEHLLSAAASALQQPGDTRTTAGRRGTTLRAPSASGSHGAGDLPLVLPLPGWSKLLILALALVAIAFAIRMAAVSRRARRLQRAHRVLSEDVGALQAALVPPPPVNLSGAEVSVAYRPADGPGAGGDFYDVFELERGRLAIIVGDVAGHGRGALREAALAHYTVRAYLEAGMSPRSALALAGRSLGRRGNEPTATVAAATFDASTSTLTYALAGHPPPIVSGVDVPEPPSVCSSPPLGSGLATGRRQATVSLPRDATVCFYTDGLTDARCANGANLLGRRRLGELARALDDPADAARLLDAVCELADATPDDMAACILTARASTRSSAGSFLEEIELDEVELSSDRPRKLLRDAGVATETADLSIDTALATARRHGAALLRIETVGGAVTVSVAAADTQPQAQPPAPPLDEPEPKGARLEGVAA